MPTEGTKKIQKNQGKPSQGCKSKKEKLKSGQAIFFLKKQVLTWDVPKKYTQKTLNKKTQH